MAKQTNNFWTGAESVESDKHSTKEHSSESVIVKEREKIGIWWLSGAIILILLVVLAVVLNLNHSHNGDNANNIAGTIDTDNGDTKINWERYPAYTITLTGPYTIESSGTYYLSGTIDDGMLTIATTSDAVVRLVLENVSIKNSSGPAISCYNGDDLVIELVGNNYLEDGASYSSELDEDVSGVIYSKADLSFTGDGKLEIKANHEDGIVGKDDVKFNSGTYLISAADDGIRGKDSVYIVNGSFNITASSDAIKSTNETDTTKGFVLIENGDFIISAKAKGIKAINSILIYSGNFDINSSDDSIHSNNYVGIMGGKIEINSGDDGIHADARLIIDGGEISIAKSYEGIEAQKISINNGKVSIYSNDDGINAGGGADASANNRVGAGTFDADENCEIIISGGELYVNAAGDGIDSNGYVYFNGGNVVVDGPTNNGNGALDAGAGISINGGNVIAIGASGMAETLGSNSSVYNISVYFSSTLTASTKIEIKDSQGQTILSHTSAKTFNHLAAGSSEFKNGETYSIYINDSKYIDFTISGITTTIGNTNSSQVQPGQKGQMR